MVDPSAVIENIVPADRKMTINRPGFINYASQKDGGKYAGCKLVQLSGHEAVNDFFAKNENLLVIELWRDAPGNVWYVLYTNTLEGDDLTDFLDFQEEVSRAMADRREKRRKERMEQEEKDEADAKEQARLAEVGKKCLANHGKKAKGE